MNLNKIIFNGKLKDIENAQQDFQNFPENMCNCSEINAIVGPETIFISPANKNEVNDIIRIPKEASNIYVEYTNHQTRFDYNEKMYFLFRDFYNPKI